MRNASRNGATQSVSLFFVAIVLSGLAPLAGAQEQPLKLILDVNTGADSNVFRVPDSNTDPQLATRGLTGRSDRSSTTRFGLRVDKLYAQQRVFFEGAQSATRYEKFAFLNRDSLNYQGAWYWQLTPRISGTLSASRSESQLGFDDTQALGPTFTINRNEGLTLDVWLFGGWHLLAGLTESERKSTTPFVAQPDSTQINRELGLRYLAPSGNSISFTHRLQEGKVGNAFAPAAFIDDRFTASESELAGVWTLSGRSSLTGRLTHISREHPNVPQRDFSGYAGDLRYLWTPTGKLAINVAATRALSPFTLDTRTSFRVDDTLSVTPVWAVSSHATLSLAAIRRTSDFLGPVVPFVGTPRRDTFTTLQLVATWLPHPKISFRASVQRDRRQSSDAAFNYDADIANVAATLTF
ncbi:MAG: outer membrane beta-barrel protein [Candidatus Parcubacteria bacterium]|nr:outer membrane beta-barrel protein [Burkholderiales bacterium]